MEAIAEMWIPILLSTALTFLASSLVWTVLPHHKKDWAKFSGATVDLTNVPAGQYIMHQDQSADWYGYLFIRRGKHNMGKALAYWASNLVLISLFVGYLVYHTTPRGTEYLQVFRVAGTAALLGFAGNIAQKSIWWGWRWDVTWKDLIDDIVYALLVAGTFAFYWS